MASDRPLPGDLKITGMDQKSLYQWMANVTDLLNEIQTDHATFVTLTDELKTDIATIATFQAALTAKLDADAGITDTDYASSLTEVVAVTAANVSSLSNSTAITLLRS